MLLSWGTIVAVIGISILYVVQVYITYYHTVLCSTVW